MGYASVSLPKKSTQRLSTGAHPVYSSAPAGRTYCAPARSAAAATSSLRARVRSTTQARSAGLMVAASAHSPELSTRGKYPVTITVASGDRPSIPAWTASSSVDNSARRCSAASCNRGPQSVGRPAARSATKQSTIAEKSMSLPPMD